MNDTNDQLYPLEDMCQYSSEASYEDDYTVNIDTALTLSILYLLHVYLSLFLQGPGGLSQICTCSEKKQWTCDDKGNGSKPRKWTTNSGDTLFEIPETWDADSIRPIRVDNGIRRPIA